MTTKTFTVKEHDLWPAIEMQLFERDGVTPINLENCFPFIVIAPCVGGRRIVDRQPVAIVAPLADGNIKYEWQDGDTDVPGEYLLEIILTDGQNGPERTVPCGGYDKLTIVPRL